MTAEEAHNLTFVRGLDMPMSRRSPQMPYVSVGLAPPVNGQLILQLPARMFPSAFNPWSQFLLHGLVPSLLALVLGVSLYRMLITPLASLQDQANALRANDLDRRIEPSITMRKDELGDLGRAFNHMADRLAETVAFQRNLLRCLSHELRTPLSRLQIANENELDEASLRQRLDKEITAMRHLVDNTLELVWLDTERPRLPLEPIDVERVWELITENACFESGWEADRFIMSLPGRCIISAHLNGFAQALENVVRNAIRYSPADGRILLGGAACNTYWHLWVDDDGPGIAQASLEAIFEPFVRLHTDRPGGDGFGLGLAIARSMVRLQGGEMWAENHLHGLRMNLRLRKLDAGDAARRS